MSPRQYHSHNLLQRLAISAIIASSSSTTSKFTFARQFCPTLSIIGLLLSFFSQIASGMNARAVSSWSTLQRLVPFASPHSRFLRQGHGPHKLEICSNVCEWKSFRSEYDPRLQFNVVTFNLLAPVYKRLQILNLETGNRKRESQNPELWRARAHKTLQFFRDEVFPHTEILGLQEFWTDPQYRCIYDDDFNRFGYDVHVLQRTGSKLDAVVLAIKRDVFAVMGTLDVILCELSDRVALVLWLKHKTSGKDFIVANTHLSFPHSALDKINQLRQMNKLTNAMEEFARSNNIHSATRMIMGDFNVEYTSRVCEHLRSLGYISCFEVSSPLNPRQPGHSMDEPTSATSSPTSRATTTATAKKRTLRFVSHRNHRNEELGVDHIFVRAESAPGFQGNQTTDSPPPATPPTPEALPPSNDLQIAAARVFVDNSRVLPLKVPCTDWENNFLVSDHRPVGATLILAERRRTHHNGDSYTGSNTTSDGHPHYHINPHSHALLHSETADHHRSSQQSPTDQQPPASTNAPDGTTPRG